MRVFLESRYRKLERGLSQTIFYCPECKGNRRRARKCARCGGFGKLTKDSVQELIAYKILPLFKGRFGKFHGAGREDLDVLMLGSGRPFVYEVVGARNTDVDLRELDERVRVSCAGRIELAPFNLVDKARVVYWKEGQFDKIYRARVSMDGEFDRERALALIGRSLEIVQRTPGRVAHRRADLRREREVSILRVDEVASAGMVIEIRCSHGTYVKEWINGDLGRTSSSLSELLGVSCSCAQLDVLEILTPQLSTHDDKET